MNSSSIMIGEIKSTKIPHKKLKNVYSICYTKKLYPSPLQKKIFFLKISWNVHKTTWFGEIRKKNFFCDPPPNKYKKVVPPPTKKFFFLESHETCRLQLGLAKFEKKNFVTPPLHMQNVWPPPYTYKICHPLYPLTSTKMCDPPPTHEKCVTPHYTYKICHPLYPLTSTKMCDPPHTHAKCVTPPTHTKYVTPYTPWQVQKCATPPPTNKMCDPPLQKIFSIVIWHYIRPCTAYSFSFWIIFSELFFPSLIFRGMQFSI